VSFFTELQRRNVFRVGAAYVVAAWLLIQVAETIFPLFGFDETPARIVVIVLAIGFIPALVLAWVFEWTPQGFRRDSDVRGRGPGADQRVDRWIMAGLVLALGYFSFDKFVLEPQREAAEQQAQAEQLATATEEAREEGRTKALLDSYGDQSIAVLPFADMSPQGDQEYFSEGIAEEILNVLARVPELRVISRSSSFAFKGQALEIPEVAKRLKVAHVLEGSVRKAGNTLRITAQLIEARSDTHLWSQTWDRELVDVFAIQDEIAAEIVGELKLTLLVGGQAVASVDPRAYEAVLRGRHLLHQLSQDTASRAVPMFEEAIEIAPDYAAAHAGLAEAFRQGGWPEDLTPDEYRSLVGSTVARALELDPDDSQALAIKGFLNYWASEQPNGEVARALWNRAIKSNPANSDALRWLASSYQQTDPLKYLEMNRRAHQVDPTRWVTGYSLTHALSDFGRYEEAIDVARAFHEMAPDSVDPILWYGDVQHIRGNIVEALKSFYFVYRSNPPDLWKWSATPWALYELEEWELMEAWARALNRKMGGDSAATEPLAASLSARGMHDEALEIVESEEGGDNGPGSPTASGVFRMRRGEYQQAFLNLKRGLTRPGADGPEINPVGNMNWFGWMNYTMAMKLAGHEDRANALVHELLQMLHSLDEAGVVARGSMSVRFLLGALYAQIGELDTAISWLQKAANQETLFRAGFLRRFPHFETLQGDPRFKAIVSEVYGEVEIQRLRLADKGMLLTPEELSALDEYEFSPFKND
jgi:TolB-like protein